MGIRESLFNRILANHPLRVAALAAVALLIPHSQAQAGLVLDFDNNAVVVNDNGPGDNNPAVGQISTNSTIAGFGVQISVAESNAPGTSTDGVLQIQSVDIQNVSASAQATLTIRLSQDGYTLPGGASSPMLLGSAMAGTFTSAGNTDSVQFRSFADPANGIPAGPVSTGNLSFTNTLGGVGPNPFNGGNTQNWTRGAGLYSLTSIATVTLSLGGIANISGSATATAVPEPVFSIGAMVAVGLLGRRRRS